MHGMSAMTDMRGCYAATPPYRRGRSCSAGYWRSVCGVALQQTHARASLLGAGTFLRHGLLLNPLLRDHVPLPLSVVLA